MLVTLPFVLLLLDYWPLGRVSGVRCQVSGEAGRARPHASAPLNHPTNPVWRPSLAQALRLVLEKLPFLALSAASSVTTFVVQRKGGAVSTSLSAGERITNALVSYLRYIGKMFWPVELSVLYPHPGHWLAVVLRHVDSGDWACPGRHPIHGGPLHLPAADRPVHHAGLGTG